MMAKYEFENKLNDCLEKLLNGAETVEQCLQRYPNDVKELEPLLRTAASVHKAVDISPSPELKARIRYNLQLKMAEAGKPRRASWFSLQPRWAIATMAVMIVFVLGSGAVLAADSSMPGSPLYPIKILTENVSLNFAGSEIEKARLSLTFADRRAAEMNYMMENSKFDSEDVDAIASRYIGNLNDVSILSAGVQATSEAGMMLMQAPASAPVAEDSTNESAVPPRAITEQTPPALTDSSAKTSENEAQDTAYSDRTKLKQEIMFYLYYHPQLLEKWLESPLVPEEDKIAIRRMLQDLKGLEGWE